MVVKKKMTLEDKKQKIKFTSEICIKGSHEIRKQLCITDHTFNLVSGQIFHNRRDYYIYGVLDEVEKAGFAVLNFEELLLEKEDDIKDDGLDFERISKNVYSTATEQLSLYVRKLKEILIELLLFKGHNEDGYYEHYLLLQDLVKKNKTFINLKEYNNCENENLKYQIKQLKSDIDLLIPTLNTSIIHYAEKNKKGELRAHKTSFEYRLKKVLPKMTLDHKTSLGFSYEGYSRVSSNIHSSIGNHEVKDKISFTSSIGHIDMLAIHILVLCKELIKKRPKKGLIANLTKSSQSKSNTREVVRKMVQPKIQKGDFVIVHGKLAQVTCVKKSKYGYRSFRISFLDEPLIEGITDDEYPAINVTFLKSRAEASKASRDVIKKHFPDMKINNVRLARSVKEQMVDLWNNGGLKEDVFGNHEEANKKLISYLKNKQKASI